MCGILLAIKKQQDVDDQFELLWDRLKQVNAARGKLAEISGVVWIFMTLVKALMHSHLIQQR